MLLPAGGTHLKPRLTRKATSLATPRLPLRVPATHAWAERGVSGNMGDGTWQQLGSVACNREPLSLLQQQNQPAKPVASPQPSISAKDS
jgi:hypothetical protein